MGRWVFSHVGMLVPHYCRMARDNVYDDGFDSGLAWDCGMCNCFFGDEKELMLCNSRVRRVPYMKLAPYLRRRILRRCIQVLIESKEVVEQECD